MNAPSRFDDLLRLWREDEASVDELAELDALLRSDARYRRSLARSIQLEVDLYARHRRAPAPPVRRRWRLESVAAVLAVAVSLIAAGAFLLRVPGGSWDGRVETGVIRVNGSEAGVFDFGASLEVSGDAAARLRLKDGPEILLDPGSEGAFADAGVFDLRRGGGTFVATPALRVVTPEGAVSGASFSARLDIRGLRVAAAAGAVEVEYDGLRHALRAGESVTYLKTAGRKPGDLREPEKRVREAGLDLASAVEKAAPGTAVKASLDREKGRLEFSVHTVRGSKLREISLDAKTGRTLDDDGEDEDRNALAAAMKISLRDAIGIALAKVPGAALEADAELKDGRVFAEIEILSAGRLYEVAVDLETGALISVGPDTP